ncbi:F-box domain containing protein [Tanacetum coccineum]
MDRLPSNILFDIFSRLPGKCLARSRCVSKVWCEYIDDRYLMIVYDEQVIEEPIPLLYHTRFSHDKIIHSLCFHVIESKQTETGTPLNYVLELKKGPFLEFLRKKPLSKASYVRIVVRGSCNGLICLSQEENDIVTLLVVVHPLKKECYELPPLPMRFDCSMFRETWTMEHFEVGSVDDAEPVWEENEPKKSELSKLFIGTAANESTKWMVHYLFRNRKNSLTSEELPAAQ